MSLLDSTNNVVIVYPEVEVVDDDNNLILRASDVGVVARVELQPARQSGTSARRAEQDNEGYETEETYRMRFPRRNPPEVQAILPLGQASQVEWLGDRWSVVGQPTFYMGSRRTEHVDYQIRRS